ncbi:MAG: AIR synthase-related protein [Candidatus Eisenbacteria bacterium]
MDALGKLTPETFSRIVAPHLGAARSEVLVGPRIGHDAAIVRIGAGRVLAITTDPLSLIPAFGPARSARLACHLIASDLWTTGIPPAYASVDFNLPPDFSDTAFEEYWQAMSDTWRELGVAVVTGHTGRYDGCDLSIVGAATLIGVGDEGRYLTPSMALPGDRVIVTKGFAIETAAVAASLFPERLRAQLDEPAMAWLVGLESQVSVVADCRAVLRVGVHDRGVTALHDATEGGVFGGLLELAKACGGDVRVERERVPFRPEVKVACEVLGVAPEWSLAEGALIACVRPQHLPAALAALAEEGIEAAEVGKVMPGSGRLWVSEANGQVTPFDHMQPDPYWDAYARALREGWH